VGDSLLVSVITPFLNAERFIEESVESVRAQTYQNWELLLVDDGSTDRSTAIALSYAEKNPARVRYLEHANHQNRGRNASRNLAIQRARGQYVALLDADDVWLPHKLEQQVAILRSQPEAAMVYGDTQFWFSWTGLAEDLDRDFMRGLGFEPNTLIKPPTLLVQCHPVGDAPPVATCSVLIRREVIDRLGAFDEAYRPMYGDQTFLAKIFLNEPVYVVDECWDKYRMQPDSCVSTVMKAGQYHAARLFYLTWLENYLSKEGVADREVWTALNTALWPYRHPVLHRLSRARRYLVEEARWSASAARVLAVQVGRSAFRRATGAIKAEPNPIWIPERFPVGSTTLSWTSTRTQTVEVRVGEPGGPLFSRSGPSGSATTGKWVSDGTIFYLQDVTDRRPLSIENTLARVRVRVTTPADTTA
jgi:glycosyltransferase involved in cell wall biosynthesis